MYSSPHGNLGHGDTHQRLTHLHSDLHLDLSNSDLDLPVLYRSNHRFQSPGGPSDGYFRRILASVLSLLHLLKRTIPVRSPAKPRPTVTGMARRNHRNIVMVGLLLCALYFMLWKSQLPPMDITDVTLDGEEIEKQLAQEKKLQYATYEPPKDRLQDENVQDILKDKQKYESRRRLKFHRIWQWASKAINKRELFSDEPEVLSVLEALATAPIVSVDQLDGDKSDYQWGTSEKWVGILEGGQKVMIKLVWETGSLGKMKDKGYCNFGHEMPGSEIAAFHLHKILGMRNTPYVAGRKINLETDILPVAAPAVVQQLVQKGNKTCVKGKCYYCKHHEFLCPRSNGLVEASVAYWIPRHLKQYTKPPKYMPFATTNMDKWKGIAMNNRSYCEKVRTVKPYNVTRYYHDLMDFAVVDTLMYHYDTKHYIIYDHSDERGMTVRLDHGRAFCAHDRDEFRVFSAPLQQCCTLRWTTYHALTSFKRPNQLTSELKDSLRKDKLAPVLDERHYPAMERRLQRLLKTVQKCADMNGGIKNILVG